ncbi:E3 ubiquitin-protein ligase DCST1-like [Coregonus clupeaformis]|uniref:E3 ubiquitin-protein ligase DCST1-like n=1 Tax=Coregonus clupeaformis TaxID=59861 RepID=UPI001E1C81C9|nr:E3 ubiquitin-protein ligase DCST1-like [Coregonus clupeaformis]
MSPWAWWCTRSNIQKTTRSSATTRHPMAMCLRMDTALRAAVRHSLAVSCNKWTLGASGLTEKRCSRKLHQLLGLVHGQFGPTHHAVRCTVKVLQGVGDGALDQHGDDEEQEEVLALHLQSFRTQRQGIGQTKTRPNSAQAHADEDHGKVWSCFVDDALGIWEPCQKGLFVGLFHNVSMTTVNRFLAGYAFVAVSILGGAFSSYFRCSVLLIFPSMLGSRGRAYLMLFVLYRGPIANIHRNVQDVAFSMGCNIELQIKHSKVMWRVVMEPFMQVVQGIVEAKSVSRKFHSIRDEIMGQFGYDSMKQGPVAAGNSTQDLYAAKTMMRYVVEQGIERCREWFEVKWQDCMNAIKAPVINHILCVSMRFHFLCDVMRVMKPWCREEIPVEGNFGQTFDKLNFSIDALSREFSTNVELQEEQQQSVFGVSALQEDFTEGLSKAFEETKVILDQFLGLIQLLLYLLHLGSVRAFGYAKQYTQDFRFDNIYITTYFRQIDARRRRICVIGPQMAGLLQVVSLAVFVCVLLAVDMVLYRIFDIIRRHTFTEFSLTSSHHIDIKVGGQSMNAKLLRKTIGAFNTSSNLDMQSSNQHCLPQPRALTTEDYLWSFVPLLMMALMCCLQVYSNRLRRVIAAFYFPKREKRRALFLYNLQIQRRISYTKRQRTRLMQLGIGEKTVLSGVLSRLERLGCRLRWCCVCGERQRGDRAVECTVPGGLLSPVLEGPGQDLLHLCPH